MYDIYSTLMAKAKKYRPGPAAKKALGTAIFCISAMIYTSGDAHAPVAGQYQKQAQSSQYQAKQQSIESFINIQPSIAYTQIPSLEEKAIDEEQKCSPVPLPNAAWLLGSGLLALLGMRRRYKPKD